MGQNLSAHVVNVKIHFIAERELFHESPELLKGIEEHNASSAVKIIGFDEPHIHAVVHLRLERELTIDDILVLEVVLDAFVGGDNCVNMLDLVSLALVIV